MEGNLRLKVTMEIDKGVTFITTERLNRVSVTALLGHTKVDEYNRDYLITTILQLAEAGFTAYGLEEFITGRLDKKSACSSYCKRAHLSKEDIFRIINPI